MCYILLLCFHRVFLIPLLQLIVRIIYYIIWYLIVSHMLKLAGCVWAVEWPDLFPGWVT